MSALEDPFETCPYELSHRILRSRMQTHLTKCSRNHPEALRTKATCPFDARHIVNKEDLNSHIETCPQRESVYQFKIAEQNELKLLPIINAGVFEPEEDWDREVEVGTYRPLEAIKNLRKPVYQCLKGESKSRRKTFRIEQRLLHQQAESQQIAKPVAQKKPSTKVKGSSNDLSKQTRLPKNSDLETYNSSVNSSSMSCALSASTSRINTKINKTSVSIDGDLIKKRFENGVDKIIDENQENEEPVHSISNNLIKLTLTPEEYEFNLKYEQKPTKQADEFIQVTNKKRKNRLAINFSNKK